jgi:hypothetical protein
MSRMVVVQCYFAIKMYVLDKMLVNFYFSHNY